ncbi:MAG: hypothetical protein ACYCS1_03295 [Gammaproteobacteria bacterium]
MKKLILFVFAAGLGASIGSLAQAGDATSAAPPSLVYEMPRATTAMYAGRALTAQNARNAANCTGGPTGHCYPGPGLNPGGGSTLAYAPDPSQNSVIVSWTSGGTACSMGRQYTVTLTPWALYSGSVFIMMMPESAQAQNEQSYLEQDHLPDPSPWTDNRTTTFFYSVTLFRIPPPAGHLCP